MHHMTTMQLIAGYVSVFAIGMVVGALVICVMVSGRRDIPME
jgi:hypothetical protein